MDKLITGKVYDIQGFSVQDGPGIRTTVFLKGCPLRCPWCHSPESQQFHAQLSWIAMRCLGVAVCGKCLQACPNNAIAPGKAVEQPITREQIRLIQVDRTLCDNCGACTQVCYPHALYVCGTDYSVAELLERVAKDLPFFEQSGGGVTLSGGEPLSQPEFTVRFLKGLKQLGIHTALDTTGFAAFPHIAAMLPYIDLFLYDLKHMTSGRHHQVIGVPNEIVLENARRIADAGGRMQIRIPLIRNFNDSSQNIALTGEFCRSLGKAVTLIQLLPYHNLGVMKYQRISDEPALEAAPPSEEKIQTLKNMLEEMGLAVTVH